MRRFKAFLVRRKSGTTEGSQRPYQQPIQQSVPSARQYGTEQRPQDALASSTPPPPAAIDISSSEPAQDQQQSIQQIQTSPGTLNIALRNDSTSSSVYAYITGQALDNGNSLFLLQADGQTPYFPTSPSSILQQIQVNCAIALGAPGNIVNVQVPHIAGGRIWFSIDTPLTFLLNPGPALVEPSVTNPSDPNVNANFAFAEFTYNTDQLYANISYVDMVSIPISLTLQTLNRGTQYVTGMRSNGLQQIASALQSQDVGENTPNSRWSQLIIPNPNTSINTPLRILSPNLASLLHQNLFTDYYTPYINQVLAKLSTHPITLDTQSSAGTLTSTPSSTITFGAYTFSTPSTSDIFSCSTGPFTPSSDPVRNAIIPRLAAAFNRSTFLVSNTLPADLATYYQDPITNHYARCVHEANVDGRGYAFPYDDVQPTSGVDQSGAVFAGDPSVLVVAVGGGRA